MLKIFAVDVGNYSNMNYDDDGDDDGNGDDDDVDDEDDDEDEKMYCGDNDNDGDVGAGEGNDPHPLTLFIIIPPSSFSTRVCVSHAPAHARRRRRGRPTARWAGLSSLFVMSDPHDDKKRRTAAEDVDPLAPRLPVARVKKILRIDEDLARHVRALGLGGPVH